MRGMAGLLLIATLAGCGDDRDFDQRFDETANQIEQRAANLDAEASKVQANAAVEERAPENAPLGLNFSAQ